MQPPWPRHHPPASIASLHKRIGSPSRNLPAQSYRRPKYRHVFAGVPSEALVISPEICGQAEHQWISLCHALVLQAADWGPRILGTCYTGEYHSFPLIAGAHRGKGELSDFSRWPRYACSHVSANAYSNPAALHSHTAPISRLGTCLSDDQFACSGDGAQRVRLFCLAHSHAIQSLN
jgi:hypothetical protein